MTLFLTMNESTPSKKKKKFAPKNHEKHDKYDPKYEIYHTPILIFCSPRAKPKCKPIERTPYQSSYVNETGFKESISIQMYTKAQTVMLSSVSSYHAYLHLLA